MTPFPIQEMTLSVALMGTDLIGQARTGTGKTLAFGIPVLQRSVAPHDPDYFELAAPGKPQALIVAPTRELALQVTNDLALASKDRGIRVLTVYGGVPYEPQLDALEAGVDVVVGTPGRLIDLMNRRALDISHVKSLVLDEADEMLDLGFLPDVERLLSQDPRDPPDDAVLGDHAGRDRRARPHPHAAPDEHPRRVGDDTQMVPATAQFIYQAHDLDKPEMIGRLLQAEGAGLIDRVHPHQAPGAAGRRRPRPSAASTRARCTATWQQAAREKALTKFREGKLQVLVATDVAARGIDVAGVTHVVNYTCPEDEKTYVHRIGRTGRAGATGIAITFVDWADLHRWKMINKALDLPFDEPQETYSTSEHLLPRPGHRAGHQGPDRPRGPGRAQAAAGPRPGATDKRGGARPASGGDRGRGQRGGSGSRRLDGGRGPLGVEVSRRDSPRKNRRAPSPPAAAAGDARVAAGLPPAGAKSATASTNRAPSGGDDDRRAERREVPQGVASGRA